MRSKLKRFVAALSDGEITDQLENIFEWAKVYKELLEEEKQRRWHTSRQSSYVGGADESCDLYDEEELDESENSYEISSSESIDYNLAQMIQQKVAMMSVEETKEKLQKLRSIPEMVLSDEEKAQLHYEMDACELHLYELIGLPEDEVVCPSCGNPLESGAKFCGKCGRRI